MTARLEITLGLEEHAGELVSVATACGPNGSSSERLAVGLETNDPLMVELLAARLITTMAKSGHGALASEAARGLAAAATWIEPSQTERMTTRATKRRPRGAARTWCCQCKRKRIVATHTAITIYERAGANVAVSRQLCSFHAGRVRTK